VNRFRPPFQYFKIMIKKSLAKAISNSDLSLNYVSISTGYSKTELSEYKNGKRSISIEKAYKIACGFGMSEDFRRYLDDELKSATVEY
jgi:transcriptional regulator with XRE-family HTH domain